MRSRPLRNGSRASARNSMRSAQAFRPWTGARGARRRVRRWICCYSPIYAKRFSLPLLNSFPARDVAWFAAERVEVLDQGNVGEIAQRQKGAAPTAGAASPRMRRDAALSARCGAGWRKRRIAHPKGKHRAVRETEGKKAKEGIE